MFLQLNFFLPFFDCVKLSSKGLEVTLGTEYLCNGSSVNYLVLFNDDDQVHPPTQKVSMADGAVILSSMRYCQKCSSQ
jgi:hypothetical protein